MCRVGQLCSGWSTWSARHLFHLAQRVCMFLPIISVMPADGAGWLKSSVLMVSSVGWCSPCQVPHLATEGYNSESSATTQCCWMKKFSWHRTTWHCLLAQVDGLPLHLLPLLLSHTSPSLCPSPVPAPWK